jgi:hypothetical protein
MKDSRTTALRRAFELYDSENPKVWELFLRFAFDLIAAGHTHYAALGILYRIRWEADVTTRSVDGFKINNNHAAYYARKFAAEFPQYDEFFRMRTVVEERLAA